MDTLAFKILDPAFAATVDDAEVVVVGSVREFLEQTADMPRIIFSAAAASDLSDLSDLFALAGADVKRDCADPDGLRNMSRDQLFIQSTEELMRGHDYSTSLPCGIALLVASDVSSSRALVQCYGRVGRYGQACKRFRLRGVGVDAAKEAAIRDRLRRN